MEEGIYHSIDILKSNEIGDQRITYLTGLCECI